MKASNSNLIGEQLYHSQNDLYKVELCKRIIEANEEDSEITFPVEMAELIEASLNNYQKILVNEIQSLHDLLKRD